MIQRSDVVVYPQSDGEPVAESMLQRRWMDLIMAGLEDVFAGRPDVVIAGDMFWYPVEGDPETRLAPDVMVVFGRPAGLRRSWLQWEEGGVAPQVVFEVLSDSNTAAGMALKRADYERLGVEEYYEIEPELSSGRGWLRSGGVLTELPSLAGWLSPRLGVRFDARPGSLRLFGPDNRVFEFVPVRFAQTRAAEAERDTLRGERDTLRDERDEARARQATIERERDEANRRHEALLEQLRRLGIELPEDGGTPG